MEGPSGRTGTLSHQSQEGLDVPGDPLYLLRPWGDLSWTSWKRVLKRRNRVRTRQSGGAGMFQGMCFGRPTTSPHTSCLRVWGGSSAHAYGFCLFQLGKAPPRNTAGLRVKRPPGPTTGLDDAGWYGRMRFAWPNLQLEIGKAGDLRGKFGNDLGGLVVASRGAE